MPKNIGYPERKLPSQRSKDRMSRADSLSSMGEFGKIVPPSEQAAERAKIKRPSDIFSRIRRALGGR